MAQDIRQTRADGQDETRQPAKPVPPEGVVLSPEQVRRRRARSIAIASVLGFLVVLFYVVTIVKLGPAVVINRPL
ncbi:hypothetical protein ACLBXM_21195 [Xanthobacteraceae bacterium A53D]